MIPSIIHSWPRKQIPLLELSAVCIATSFSVGMRTAGNVQPFALIEAGSTDIAGDIDGNGILSIDDAVIILEVVQGYRPATPASLKADPNEDGVLTVDDALHILANVQ